MEAAINVYAMETLLEEIERFVPVAVPTGHMMRQITEAGFYEEQGLRFTSDDLALGQLYAGLAVLSRDMYHHLTFHPRQDADLFMQVIAYVNAVECTLYGDQAFPYYEGLPVADLPDNLAVSLLDEHPNMAPLGHRAIVHEWTLKPGKRLFVRFGAKLKETVCGRGGPYMQFKKGLLGKAELPAVLVTSILTAGFSSATFWCPLAVYLSLLFIKAGLKTYCESENGLQQVVGQVSEHSIPLIQL